MVNIAHLSSNKFLKLTAMVKTQTTLIPYELYSSLGCFGL